jgi:pimeloyl-ACP methyl ester carboxylesterase
MDFETPHQQRVPAPSTLENAATGPPNQTLKSRRRPASPAKPADARPKKRSPNYVHTQAASPAVISSLIDQLSAISIPAHDHFENLLVGYSNGLSAASVTSVNTGSRGNSSAGQDGSSVNHSAYNHSIKEQNDLFPTDDACEPPVIRTSKPPSGYSSVTAPKKKEKSHSLSSYIGRNSCSSASLHSTHSNRSVVSIGNISIEAGGPKPRSGGSERSSAESKRSTKGHRGLMYMGSRERLRLKETERKRHTTHAAEDALAPHDSPRKTAAPSFSYEDTIKEEPTSREEDKPFQIESSRFAQRFSDRSSSPRRLRINLVDGPNGESPSEQGLIPERGSSLRHTGSPTRKNKKNRASDTTRRDVHKSEPVVDETAKMDPESVIKDKMLQELEREENEVARRIRVLKEQKLQRDRIAGERTVDGDAGAAPSSIPRVSAIPSPEPSPTSTVSSESARRAQDPAKAHRVLGITYEPATTESPAEVEKPVQRGDIHEFESRPVSAMPQVHARRHSRHRSFTLNDGDDMTPLPINYTLALQTLEEASPPTPTTTEMPRARSPPPPSGSVASSKETRSSAASPQRSSSLAVGGRSAIGRKASSLMTVPQIHQKTSSITDGMLNVKPPSIRSASDTGAARHNSMIMPLPDSHSLQLQRRRTSAKKRWSHPDLPAKAEKEHNDRVERQEAAALGAGAVQRPARPVIEERPASQDSIDIEVDSYLNSPRLSQRIRHPQTGRVISFSEVGDPDGFAVFVCVGMGLTRYVMAFYDQLAATLKLRLITPDRPGIGGSQADPNGTPLSWPGKFGPSREIYTNTLTDDVLVICQVLKITKFSMLAHSAGAVYALATSLRMPQHIRGRVHLLAPWIPPSQMAPIGISQDSPPTQQLPRSQRFLRALPPSLLKVANSTFLSATSASLQRTGPKNSPKTKRKSSYPQIVAVETLRPSIRDQRRESMMLMDQVLPNASSLSLSMHPSTEAMQRLKDERSLAERDRQRAFDERLTFAIWDRATAHANPATDLIVCLETRQTIGFRYEDINRPVVIHHGSKDSRVPVANVRWLGKLMRKCEVRILEGEQHGLMASAQVMGNVLTEMASEWEDWSNVVQGKGDGRSLSRKRTAERLRSTMSRDTLASKDERGTSTK